MPPLRTLLPLSLVITLALPAALVGYVVVERRGVGREVEAVRRVQELAVAARVLSLYVQYNAHDTSAYTLGHLGHRQEFVRHAAQFRRVLGQIERGLARDPDPKAGSALAAIGPSRARYDRGSSRLFVAADRNRRAPTPSNQEREDAAWVSTDKLGDRLDQESQALALSIGTQMRALRHDIDAHNSRIALIVMVLGLASAVLIAVIQFIAAKARAAADSGRRRTESLLAQNESLLNSAGEGIFGIDGDGRITFVNPAATRMTGYESDELIGLSKHDLIHHTRPDGTPYPVQDSPVTAALQQGTVQSADQDVYFRKDGSSFPVEYTITPILERGRVKGAVVVFKDITERREIERAKDEFTSMVSHELRTPLTSIRGSLGLLESGVLGPLPEKGRRMVEIAVQNTNRLVRLINDILDIERIDSDKLDMHAELCDARALVELAVQSLGQLAAEAQVSLVVEGEPVALFADPDRVLQTLTNLISNAVKFSPPDSTVRLSSKRRGQEVLFEVSDGGRGIPADKLDAIFERFQQVDASDSREKGGTGLGLAICRTIVEHHGGRIWVQSELGRGSTFSFVLPAPSVDDEPARDRPAGGPLILVCDDDASVVEVVGAMLEQRGYRVIAAHSGEQAVERAMAERPDAILLDLLMPGMSGWETAAALKEHPETRAVPIVILSVLSPAEAEASGTPVADWVQKPLDEAMLFAALERAVAPCGEPFKVLIVEDDPDVAAILGAMFDRHGIQVFRAADGREAIELSQHILPDLLVLDIGLPETDGFQVVDWLRRHERLSALPLVVYTARELDRADRERLRLGASTEFLIKSRITPEDFEQRVMGLLGRLTHPQTPEVSDEPEAHPVGR
ncbi:MAG: Two-component hybrid sensor and histidine kinase regulator [Solirubrobacterales bacterium]|nr:Two-component hybrid sensor and histidine kinase regulator [Solirubrobacterales bacterium]